MNIEDDVVAQQMAHDTCRLAQPENAPDRLYSFTTAEGANVNHVLLQGTLTFITDLCI